MMLTSNEALRLPDVITGPDLDFEAGVIEGLSRPRKSLPCRFFYDARGSELFEEITKVPEYYPTRTEIAILEAHAAEMTETVLERAVLVEFGSGSSRKTEILLRLCAISRPMSQSMFRKAPLTKQSGASWSAFRRSLCARSLATSRGRSPFPRISSKPTSWVSFLVRRSAIFLRLPLAGCSARCGPCCRRRGGSLSAWT